MLRSCGSADPHLHTRPTCPLLLKRLAGHGRPLNAIFYFARLWRASHNLHDFLNVRHGLKHRDIHSLLHARWHGNVDAVDDVGGLNHVTDLLTPQEFVRLSPRSVAVGARLSDAFFLSCSDTLAPLRLSLLLS